MTIPENKQSSFEAWFKQTAAPEFEKYGALKHELYKVCVEQLKNHQLVEKNRYIESLFFVDSFNVRDFFSRVKSRPRAYHISQAYEREFQAGNIEFRILSKIS